MKFFSLKDRLDDVKWSSTAGGKVVSGTKLLGAVVANTAIGVGKVAVAAAPLVKKRIDEEKRKR
ncbi:hypothetical protein [Bordetella genomosp. 13]|uniref:Uncharacterized protein n=1 Tax=Bordetella genomosp. 13 TaxID=463040 RepID=A0A1W6ZCY5_9BORD|nr:hypothetical protein [Bordetella genomosp. 13]ARP95248.1 hypothetical protein CAL15_13150 [Bordetella genomosp. 13]